MNAPILDGSRADVVELRIPARAEWVALARLAAAAIANRLELSIDDLEDVKLAVAEACTAVIQHRPHGEFIDIVCETQPDVLRVNVRDGGRREGANDVPVARELDDARVAGLGVFLIRTLMDDVSYDVHPERGTSLLMAKRIRAGRA